MPCVSGWRCGMSDLPVGAGCEAVRDLLPELAAGVAAGDDRARALAHLAG